MPFKNENKVGILNPSKELSISTEICDKIDQSINKFIDLLKKYTQRDKDGENPFLLEDILLENCYLSIALLEKTLRELPSKGQSMTIKKVVGQSGFLQDIRNGLNPVYSLMSIEENNPNFKEILKVSESILTILKTVK